MTVKNVPSSSNRLLTAARVAWATYAVGLLILALASMPGYYNHVITGTVPENISFELGNPPAMPSSPPAPQQPGCQSPNS